MTVVDPDARRARLGASPTRRDDPDPVNDFTFLREAYVAPTATSTGASPCRCCGTSRRGRIVNNESREIIRMLDREFDALATHPERRLCPERRCAPRSTRSTTVVYDDVNNGVYRAGFARTQAAYERGVRRALRRARRARRAARDAPLPARRHDHRGRLAPVHHPAALRPRLRRPLQVQPAPHRRLPQPLGLPARPLPAAGHRRRPSTSTTSSATTTARIPRSTRSGSCPSARRST